MGVLFLFPHTISLVFRYQFWRMPVDATSFTYRAGSEESRVARPVPPSLVLATFELYHGLPAYHLEINWRKPTARYLWRLWTVRAVRSISGAIHGREVAEAAAQPDHLRHRGLAIQKYHTISKNTTSLKEHGAFWETYVYGVVNRIYYVVRQEP